MRLILKRKVVQYDCPICQQELESPFAEAGTEQQCPHCLREFKVPGEREVEAHGQQEMREAEARARELTRRRAEAAAKNDLERRLAQVNASLLEPADRAGVASPGQGVAHNRPPPPVIVPPAAPISGAKLFGIVTAAVACGITIALICYAVFFAAAGSSGGRRAYSEVSHLSVDEQAFVKSIEGGEPSLVREYLTKPLDWKQVATPALRTIIRHDRFRSYGYESPDERRDRQFWIDLADRLVKEGADTNQAMFDAYSVETLDFLISHQANQTSRDMALRRLASDTWEKEVELLIRNGANVNSADFDGSTALHNAAKDNAVKVIGRLLAAGANVNAKNKAGQTPLKVANLTLQKEAAAFLTKRGGEGMTCSLAESSASSAVRRHGREAGCKRNAACHLPSCRTARVAGVGVSFATTSALT